jgi:hypothetical protein
MQMIFSGQKVPFLAAFPALVSAVKVGLARMGKDRDRRDEKKKNKREFFHDRSLILQPYVVNRLKGIHLVAIALTMK